MRLAFDTKIRDVLTRYCQEQIGFTPRFNPSTLARQGNYTGQKETLVTNLHNRWQLKPYVIFRGYGGEHVIDKADIWPWLDATGVDWRRGVSKHPDQMHPRRTSM